MKLQRLLVKSLLVVLGMLCAMTSHAQGSVTLYGIVDGGLLYLSKTQGTNGANAGRFFGFTDSGGTPSQFGIKGKEDLGGGLYAEFDLESGIDIGNGGFNDSNLNLFGRQAWVGLHGNFGQVRAGLQYSPFFDTIYALDPRGLPQLGSGVLPYINNALLTGIFTSNAITYTSPVLGGLQGSALFAPGGIAGDFQAGRTYSASLAYHWGGLGVYAAYYNGNAGGPSVSPLGPAYGMDARTIGASYKFGVLIAKASFTNYKVVGSGQNDNVWGGGLDYLPTPSLDLNGGVWYMVNRDDAASKSLMGSVGATYWLSKRTGLYTQVGVVNNKGNANLGLEVGDAPNSPSSLYAPAGTTVGVDIGIHHSF